ncbi:unnamed protein product [Adineta steineri]|uniref:Uncharacterized protein n=1 Tax=Adineta steineri TaxID=433720 RepID=A0A815DAN9_9BILA|nr:unnamed protein product [Adineta steineri]CAF3928713.1 unnamed protein product [Adineta steineri]
MLNSTFQRNEPFYELFRKLAGAVEAKLLQVQGVRSAYSLMHIEDVFDILKYELTNWIKFKKIYFTQLLNLKNQEHMKTIELRMESKYTLNAAADNSNTSTSQSLAQVLSVFITNITKYNSNNNNIFKRLIESIFNEDNHGQINHK